ncbi:MAG: FKBP-type peptidyl-prolyl cis-trans isomerase [Ginsengibacter sp.]
MNKSIYLVAIGFLIMAAGCSEQSFKKAEDGSEYKVIKNEKGAKAVAGNFLELHILVKYKDSVLFSTTENGMPNFMPYDTASLPKFFRDIHEGDSLIIRQSTDSILKKGQAAPWMAKGNYIIQGIKVVRVFKNQQEADSIAKTFEGTARAKAFEKTLTKIEKDLADNSGQSKTDDDLIKIYMEKNNLKGEKTKWGTYVVITKPGTGPKLTQNDVAVVNYTGKTLKDTTFDSNTDKNFQHVEPFYVDMGQFRVVPGWIDGLNQLQKGSVGKLIIPSTLGWGKAGSGAKIGPDENVVFDIEVTDVITHEAYEKQMAAQQQMMQMMQQQMQQQKQQPRP